MRRSLGWPRISGLGDLVGMWRCPLARWRECEEGHQVRGEAPCHGDLTSKERCPICPGACGPGAPRRALSGADMGRQQLRWRRKSRTAPRRGSGEEGSRKGGGDRSQGEGGRDLVGCHWLPDKGDFRQRLGTEAGLQLV